MSRRTCALVALPALFGSVGMLLSESAGTRLFLAMAAVPLGSARGGTGGCGDRCGREDG